MAEKLTPDQSAAEKIGRAIDGQVYRLEEERKTLLAAAERIAEIDAELAILQAEKTAIDKRRPPKTVEPGPTREVSSPDVNTTRQSGS